MSGWSCRECRVSIEAGAINDHGRSFCGADCRDAFEVRRALSRRQCECCACLIEAGREYSSVNDTREPPGVYCDSDCYDLDAQAFMINRTWRA